MRSSRLSPLVAGIAAASLAVGGCGGGGSSTANKGAPLSKSAFCSAAKKYVQDGKAMGNDGSLAEAKSELPKLLADAKAMTPAPGGLQSSMEKVISDMTLVNSWVQKQTSNKALDNAPANVKAALADLDKHPQVKAWLKKNCPGVVVNSGSGSGASGGGGSSGAGGGAGNS